MVGRFPLIADIAYAQSADRQGSDAVGFDAEQVFLKDDAEGGDLRLILLGDDGGERFRRLDDCLAQPCLGQDVLDADRSRLEEASTGFDRIGDGKGGVAFQSRIAQTFGHGVRPAGRTGRGPIDQAVGDGFGGDEAVGHAAAQQIA